MPEVSINYLAVLVAGIVTMALGAFWYSPALFGKQWMKLMGLTQESMKEHNKGMGARYGAAFVATLLTAYVLAHIVDFARATDVGGGLQAGFWVWLGFVATKSLGGVLWENRPFKLYTLNNAYDLISLLIMGAILGVWQ